MAKTIKLEVITPSKLFYKGECELVIVRTHLGDEGFMANHAWSCKLLAAGGLWIQEPDNKEFKAAAVAGGYIDVKDSIIIYTDAAEWQEEIDKDRAMQVKADAERWLKEEAHKNQNEIALAQAAISKSLARMKMADSGGRRRR